MHVGRQYRVSQFLGWTRWEAGCLLAWALLVTAVLQLTHWTFLTIRYHRIGARDHSGVQESAMLRALQPSACAVVGRVFVSLEKVGENSSNPFEGGPNDVPISFIARRIEIEMRIMLGEQTDLKQIEAKDNILF